jgi:hypothetical protein
VVTEAEDGSELLLRQKKVGATCQDQGAPRVAPDRKTEGNAGKRRQRKAGAGKRQMLRKKAVSA